jgi:hypothetical protein
MYPNLCGFMVVEVMCKYCGRVWEVILITVYKIIFFNYMRKFPFLKLSDNPVKLCWARNGYFCLLQILLYVTGLFENSTICCVITNDMEQSPS